MNPRLIVLAVVVAVFTLASVAAAGPDATQQRVAINVKVRPEGTFVLTPLRPGAIKRDSGTFRAAGGSGANGRSQRAGGLDLHQYLEPRRQARLAHDS